MISVAEAENLIAQHLPRLGSDMADIDQAGSRVLAKDIEATRFSPPFDRVAMDGIALQAKQTEKQSVFEVEFYAKAGAPQHTLEDSEKCIEIGTGAPLPKHCDTVIPYEKTQKQGASFEITTELPVASGLNIHRMGQDVKLGDIVLRKGQRIQAPEIAVLASNGYAKVPTVKQVKLAIISTGDELVALGQKPEPHQLYRSNEPMLCSLFKQHHHTLVSSFYLPDNQAEITKELEPILASHDLILITGGVSKGKYDYIPDSLAQLSVEAIFHRVAQRPGKPLWFGVSSAQAPVFGIPGNPVSALICARRYVLPALEQMQGISNRTPQGKVTLASSLEFAPPLSYFPAVYLGEDNVASYCINHGSGDFSSLAGSHGFVELPASQSSFLPGQPFTFYSWNH